VCGGKLGLTCIPTQPKGYRITIMKKYTLRQIMKMWKQLYGENFKTEYSGFYNLLKKGK
jgi:hypothetical protein